VKSTKSSHDPRMLCCALDIPNQTRNRNPKPERPTNTLFNNTPWPGVGFPSELRLPASHHSLQSPHSAWFSSVNSCCSFSNDSTFPPGLKFRREIRLINPWLSLLLGSPWSPSPYVGSMISDDSKDELGSTGLDGKEEVLETNISRE